MALDSKIRPLPVYIALDVDTYEEAVAVVNALGDDAMYYKVGLQLFSAAGRSIVEWLRAKGKSVFLDLKFHDIPQTVEKAVRQAAMLGVQLCTVHSLAGREALVRAVGAAQEYGAASATKDDQMGILAVTLLTSIEDKTACEIGLAKKSIAEHVRSLALLAQAAGAHGVVCSAAELQEIKRACPQLRALVPGIRPAGADRHDQARVATPSDAARWGADYLVVGRAVTTATDRRAAYLDILRELADAGYYERCGGMRHDDQRNHCH